MQSVKSILFILIMCSFLGACGGSSGSNSPSIGNIYTDVYHQHTSFFDKWSISPNRTIRFIVSAEVSDPQGVENLDYVYIEDKSRNWLWSFLGGYYEIPLEECYYQEYGFFECLFYDANNLDNINLSNWVLVAEDKQGNRTEKPFQFLLPDGDGLTTETFVYSQEYSGVTTNGVAALEAMTIADNNIVFTSNPATQSFHIEFNATDSRAKNYGLAFYDGSSGIEYIGEACLCSPSIESMPIVFGQTTTVDIPWSEIDFEPGYDANDIDGLHIKLYDDPIEWVVGGEDIGSWFNYISFSEFVTLP